ncbi:glycosyltransferase family 2 protein [Ruegeria pomeroyi]|uniref:Glycosyltransferase family 2 protein n=1 Tax=Ruegeria pomeroyi TaxID=89184 RepID=A0A9Q3WQR9_9RHOB|nr:glycosyltransferase family 2 protein [Ruegeria pomeroyi]MCE8519053.1 glycosyltransferase family 2 protein [Ruegeria pomeroyi]MCE8540160.1 glycosyltransferase family 2 protein [Ruegeria pomeroyi]
MSPSPRVSVITPAYNAAAVLPRAVASVQAQSLRDWEMLVVDDGSTDDTLAIARALAAGDPRITVMAQARNGGPATARNRALAAARGRFIAFLDADDAWLPEKLERQLAFMTEHGAGLSYTGFWRIAAGRRWQVNVPGSVTRAQLLRGNVIGCLTAIYDREVYGTVEMPDLPMRQDYALWLDLLSRKEPALGLDLPLAEYHRTPGSLSAKRFRALGATWRLYRDHAGLSAPHAAWCLSNHLVRRLIRG